MQIIFDRSTPALLHARATGKIHDTVGPRTDVADVKIVVARTAHRWSVFVSGLPEHPLKVAASIEEALAELDPGHHSDH